MKEAGQLHRCQRLCAVEKNKSLCHHLFNLLREETSVGLGTLISHFEQHKMVNTGSSIHAL